MRCQSFLRTCLIAMLCIGHLTIAQTAVCQDTGEDDLDAATELLLKKQLTTRDFDKVADLCESAIEKGLEPNSEDTAKQMWASALYEHAALSSKKVIDQFPPDRRWQFIRQQAMNRLEKAVELAPDLTKAHLLIAKLNILLQRGDKDVAKQALEKVLELSKDDPVQSAETYVLRSQLTDDEKQQLDDLNKALEIDDSNAMALQLRGRYYLEIAKDVDKGVADFRKLAETQKDNPATFLLLAQTLAEAEKHKEAIEFINRALEINPDIMSAYQLRARLNLILDDDAAAKEDIDKILQLNPRDIGSLLIRAQINYTEKNYDEALKDVNKVLLFQPGTIAAHRLRSFIYSIQEKHDQAIEDMQLLARAEPDETQWQIDLAMIYNSAERPRQAIEVLTKVLEIEEENETALFGRGNAYLSTGQHREAIEDYERAMKVNADDDGVLNNLAWVLATSTFDELRNGDRSIELGIKACELTEYKKAHILSTLAAGYAETGDFETAIKWSTKSVELAEDERQLKDLSKELESYKKGEPWRENQSIKEPSPDQGGGDLKVEDADKAGSDEKGESKKADSGKKNEDMKDDKKADDKKSDDKKKGDDKNEKDVDEKKEDDKKSKDKKEKDKKGDDKKADGKKKDDDKTGDGK